MNQISKQMHAADAKRRKMCARESRLVWPRLNSKGGGNGKTKAVTANTPFLTIIPQAHVGYEMVDSQPGA